MENIKTQTATQDQEFKSVSIPPAPGNSKVNWDAAERPFEVPLPPELPTDQRTIVAPGHYADMASTIDSANIERSS